MKITTTKRLDSENLAIQVEKGASELFEFYVKRKDNEESICFYMNQEEFDKFKLLILPLF